MSIKEIPSEALCTKTHEYVLIENNVAKIGITDYAVEQLGDIVFVELPEVNSKWTKGQVFGTIESVKAASELYLPISGTIIEVNEKLINNPEIVNDDCYGEGWLIKVAEFNKDELKDAMIPDKYREYLEKE